MLALCKQRDVFAIQEQKWCLFGSSGPRCLTPPREQGLCSCCKHVVTISSRGVGTQGHALSSLFPHAHRDVCRLSWEPGFPNSIKNAVPAFFSPWPYMRQNLTLWVALLCKMSPFLVSDPHSSLKVTFGKSKKLSALILNSYNWNQRVYSIYPVNSMLDNTWKRSRRTCRNLLQERLGTNTLFRFLLLCRHFCSLAISFSNISFLPQELELCHFTSFSLLFLFQTTKPFIFPSSSKTERPVSHMQSVGLKFPNTIAILKQDMQGCRDKGYSFLKSWCFLLSPWGEILHLLSPSSCLSKCCH